MKNNLSDLNDHLFSMLELLSDDEAMSDKEKMEQTMARAEAICSVATKILNVAEIQISAINIAGKFGLDNKSMPALIATKDSAMESKNRQMLMGGDTK